MEKTQTKEEESYLVSILKLKQSRIKAANKLVRVHYGICEDLRKKKEALSLKKRMNETLFNDEVKSFVYGTENLQMIAFFNNSKKKLDEEIKIIEKELVLLEEHKSLAEFEYSISKDQILVL